jgi:hypothetical protein
MEWWHVYLFTRLDGLKDLFCVMSILFGIFGIIAICFYPIIDDIVDRNQIPAVKKGVKMAVAIFAITFFAGISIPTQKEAAAIYLLPKLAKSDFAKEAQQIPTDAAKLMRLKLESWIADMSETAKPAK